VGNPNHDRAPNALASGGPSAPPSEDKPVDAVFEYDLVEIDQKTQWFIQESHVAKQLSLVNWKDLLDCLELNDQTIVNQHVKTKWFFKRRTLCIRSERSICSG
jgi:hypothetical protein